MIVGIVVNTDGLPEQPHIVTTGGKKLDDAALTAVEAYRFRPAQRDGKPVSVDLKVFVLFQVY